MCGFVGILFYKNLNSNILEKMSENLKDRGPDDSGYYIDDERKIAIAHRRLSILDLSKAGHQPMKSFSGRYVIAFNGEIYNHNNLRSKLEIDIKSENFKWNGTSDTETLLACFEYWGVENTIKECEGMFSIALWDNKLNNLKLIRDRIGEKPLYYGFNNNSFYFGSDLKALQSDPNFNPEIDKDSLELFFKLDYIPAPKSIYKNISKLLQGHILTISNDDKSIKLDKYWDLLIKDNFKKYNYKETIERTEKLIEETVKKQMISDVPIGSFLSGGTDSSIVSYFMQKNSINKINTFTIGFDHNDYDESKYANSVAKFIGTNHSNINISNDNFLEIIPNLWSIYSEPFADSSQIVTYLVSKEAKKNVSVILSGDGGDECFAGYNRHMLAKKIFALNKYVPFSIRIIISYLLGSLSPSSYNKIHYIFKNFTNSKYLVSNVGDRLHKLKTILRAKSNTDSYKLLISHSNNDLFNFKNDLDNQIDNFLKLDINSINDILFNDIKYYLSDDIMCKVDRASMANSLETRMPLADSKLIEYTYNISNEYKLKNQESKHLLKNIISKYFPKKIFDRPKMGFEAPIPHLLRGPLKDWANDILSSKNINQYDFLNFKNINNKWKLHKDNKANYHQQLWSILIFCSWMSNK